MNQPKTMRDAFGNNEGIGDLAKHSFIIHEAVREHKLNFYCLAKDTEVQFHDTFSEALLWGC
jgi:hypothetical protein